MAPENSSASASSIHGVLTHGGKYVRYNVHGNFFEVSSKYVPPLRPIGRGAYGIVCAAIDKETNEEVSIKKIGNSFDNCIDAKRTLREIKLLRHLDHENIIAIRDIIRPPKREAFDDVYIVYELMDTDLHQVIRSEQALTDDHCQPSKIRIRLLELETSICDDKSHVSLVRTWRCSFIQMDDHGDDAPNLYPVAEAG